MKCPICSERHMIKRMDIPLYKLTVEADWYECKRCGCEFGIKRKDQ